MDWQQVAALAIVAGVVTLWGVARWRRRGAGGCGGGCCGVRGRGVGVGVKVKVKVAADGAAGGLPGRGDGGLKT